MSDSEEILRVYQESLRREKDICRYENKAHITRLISRIWLAMEQLSPDASEEERLDLRNQLHENIVVQQGTTEEDFYFAYQAAKVAYSTAS